MSMLPTPSTPNRKYVHSIPRTPCRRRETLTMDSPGLPTPLSPSPARVSSGKQLEFEHPVARRLFFTPQHGSQSYIPPSPPLTPTTPSAMAIVQATTANPNQVQYSSGHKYHPYNRASSASAPAQLPIQLGSPAAFKGKNKKAKLSH